MREVMSKLFFYGIYLCGSEPISGSATLLKNIGKNVVASISVRNFILKQKWESKTLPVSGYGESLSELILFSTIVGCVVLQKLFYSAVGWADFQLVCFRLNWGYSENVSEYRWCSIFFIDEPNSYIANSHVRNENVSDCNKSLYQENR